MKSRPRILMDCDPGIDDAFAIMCALRYCDLAAITTVNGNVSVHNTTRNARHLVHLAGAEVPVHRGAAAPMQVPAITADEIHGISGLGDLFVPDSPNPESDVSAIDAIIDFCSQGSATIVATGPLTNIAQAFATDPTLVNRIDRLFWMGGSTTVGNVTEKAEFNAWADPHAVAATFDSGVAITMFGLNLTHQVRMNSEHVTTLRQADTTTSAELADLLDYYSEHGVASAEGQPVHDTCALLGLTHPELFQVAESNIVAHVDDDRRGMTEVTNHADTDGLPSVDVLVAHTADASAVIDLVINAAIDPLGGSVQ